MKLMRNHLDKLVIGKISLPDPYCLVEGWCNSPSHLPDTLYNDVQDYLMKHNPGNAFKNVKSLLESGHLSGIKTHNTDINVDIVLFEAIVVPSKGFKMLTTTFGFTCRKIVGKLSILVVLLLMGNLYLPIIYFIKTFSQNSWLLFEVLAYQKTVFEFAQIFIAEKYYKIFKT